MSFYSDPTLYSTPLGSYSLYLSGPYSNHSSLIAARSARPNTYVKPLTRFHRGYAPHLSTISENQIRRKYSPSLALHTSSAKYKVPRPIKINTADIDVSADRYKPRVPVSTNLNSSKTRTLESKKEPPKSTSSEQVGDVDDFTPKPIRRDRPTVRLHTLHKDEEGKNYNVDSTQPRNVDKKSASKDIDSNKNKTDKEAKTIRKNPSFHDICTAISQDHINEELNPGQPDSVKRRQSRTFSNEDFTSERCDSAETPLKTDHSQERIQKNEKINEKEHKVGQTIDFLREEQHKFDSRGSVKRKKKLTRKKTNESLLSDDEVKSTVQRKPQKKFKRTGTDTSISSDLSEDIEKDYQEAVRDISNVEVEEIKVKPKPLISATVDVGETIQSKPNLKLIVNDVEVEEVPKTLTKLPKLKFNVTVKVENSDIRNKRKLNKTKITEADKGKVHIPKTNGILVSEIRQNHQRASLGDIFEDFREISSTKTERNKIKKESTNCDIQTSEINELIVSPTKDNRSSFKNKDIDFDHLVQNNLPEKTDIILNGILSDSVSESTEENKTLSTTSENNTLEKQSHFSDNTKEKSEEMRKKQDYKLSAINNKTKVTVELNNIQNEKQKEDKNKILEINKKLGRDIKKLNQNIIKPELNTKPILRNVEVTKKEESNSPEIKCILPPKEENASSENFWDLIGTRDSVYMQPTNVFKRNTIYVDDSKKPVINEGLNVGTKVTDDGKDREKVKSVTNNEKANETLHEEEKVNHVVTATKTDECDGNVQNKKDVEEDIPKKMTSKGSLVNKPTNDDPDLNIFIVPAEPEQEKEPESESPESDFTPLMSNRLSQWMHPFKKPEQYDECPIEIFARPKPIKGRHYPRPRDPLPLPQPKEMSESDNESEEESTEDETDETEETSSDNEGNVGKSTSSIDSGFNSTNGSPAMQRNKGSSDTRDSPTSNPAHNPAFALDPGDTLEDYYTSSTFASFQKSGRITPPATTIPRFRKYNLEDFNFLKVLGKGSFGKVLLAELKDTEYYYAIKCLKKDVVLEDDDVECTLIERKVLALGTKHPYLCHLLCTFQTESHLFFVMEYLNGGDLMFHIQNSGRFPEARARIYGAEIISGLKFLHSKGIVYRDLKLDNILLDFDGHVRIADFGMCKLQIFLDRMADTFCGTPDYMAPEIIKGLHYNQCVDWWSFGVLLYEMLIGQSPFSGCDEDELFWSICNEKPVLPRFLSAEATSVLKQFLEKDANKRLGNKMSPHGEIQDHIFFRSISWDLLEKRQVEAPFKPNLQHPLDTQYFDKTFTVEKAKLTPIDKNILQSMDQMQFQGFSYTNPNATDR